MWLDDVELTPDRSWKVYDHSPDGFMWGYGGSGPAQLALAILLEITTEELARMHYHGFKRAWVAQLPQGENFERELDVRSVPVEEGVLLNILRKEG